MNVYEVEIKLLDEIRFKGLLCDAASIVRNVEVDEDDYTDFLEDLYKGRNEIAYFPTEDGALTYKTYRRQFDNLKEMLDYLISSGFELTYKKRRYNERLL
jgi:hypothetical protein